MEQDRYQRGAHTVLDIQYHFVWKTKYGFPVMRGSFAQKIRMVIAQTCAEKKLVIIRGHVRTDHIHMLIRAPGDVSPSKIMNLIKGKSSYRLQREFPEIRKQYWGQHIWARGFFCATVGAVTEETIKKYIEDQQDDPGNFKIWDEELESDSSEKL
jgi:putative transposase